MDDEGISFGAESLSGVLVDRCLRVQNAEQKHKESRSWRASHYKFKSLIPNSTISNLRDLEENEVKVSLCVGRRLAGGKIATGHFTFKLHGQTQEGEKGETESLKRTLRKL
ncbi:hypothetical protein ACFX2H_032969 [Malus domestica]